MFSFMQPLYSLHYFYSRNTCVFYSVKNLSICRHRASHHLYSHTDENISASPDTDSSQRGTRIHLNPPDLLEIL